MLKELGRNYGDSVERRLARSAVGVGLRIAAKSIKNAAPKGSRIKRSVGTRFKRNRRSGVHEAKAGLNVGGKQGTAPHAHFFTLGTGRRMTATGENRGMMRPDPFVRDSISGDRGAIVSAMQKQIVKRLPFELARAKAKAKAGGS